MQEKKYRSRRSEPVLAGIEIRVFLFCIFLFLCIWPLLTNFGQGSPDTLFVYYFGVLTIHAIVMIVLAKYISGQSSQKDKESNSEEPHNG